MIYLTLHSVICLSFCYTQWYSKPSVAGSSMELWFSTQMPDKTIRPNSSLVLLLDQDCHDSSCQCKFGLSLKKRHQHFDLTIAIYDEWWEAYSMYKLSLSLKVHPSNKRAIFLNARSSFFFRSWPVRNCSSITIHSSTLFFSTDTFIFRMYTTFQLCN